jgi:hypothetical protein
MIASVECPMATIRPLPSLTLAGQEARDLALACLRYESACWRGESARDFAMRLGSYWKPQMPPAPMTEPDAVSPHGAGGRGISWFEKSGEILGYIAGRRSGYRIPVTAITGLAWCVPQHPCMAQSSLRTFDSQAVIH